MHMASPEFSVTDKLCFSKKRKMDSAKPKNVNKKRKEAADSKDSKPKKKKSSYTKFTEINFKLMIKETSTSFIALENFQQQARAYPDDTDYDIVAHYCKVSAECVEIFQLLEGGKRKPGQVSAIFETLELILMRTADDLVKLQHVAQNITRRVLASHLGLVYSTLSVSNKAAHIKSALKLLTAMVMQGESSARNVHLQFRLDHPSVRLLLNRRDKKDPQDIRTCVIHFMLSFLIAGDSATIRQIVEHKDFLSLIFAGIQFDGVPTIQLILSTLLDKVLQNPALNKTCRIGVFGERSLTELSKLYQWKGPSNWHNKWKTKGKFSKQEENTEVTPSETSDVDKASVRGSIHQFLLELTTSLVSGITFLDKSYGTSGKNQNHLVTHLLHSLLTPQMDDLETELVVKATAVCPDLLHWYLPSLKHAMEPRQSESWVKCVALVTKIYQAQPAVLPVFTTKESLSPAKDLSIAMSQLVPPKDIWKTIIASLQSDPRIQMEGLRLLLLILTRINTNIRHCVESSADRVQLAEFVDLFRDSLKKILPDSNAWMTQWKSCVEKQSDRGSEEVGLTSALPLPPPVAIARALLSVICAYQTAVPPALQTHTLTYGVLLEGVQEVTTRSQGEEDNAAMWADMFQIMCESGERSIQWTKPNKTGKSFLYLLLETVTTVTGKEELKQQIVGRVVQMLQTTGIFPGLDRELMLWLTKLLLVEKSGTKDVLQFMEQTLFKLFKDPYTYTERVLEVVSEALSSTSPGGGTSGTSVASTSEVLVDMILSLDDDITLDKGSSPESPAVDTSTHLSFSPLVPVVLEELTVSGHQSSCVQQYIGSVVHSVLRTQTHPTALCLLIHKYRDCLRGQPLLRNVAYFLPEAQTPVTSPVKKKKKKSEERVTTSDRSVPDILEEIFERSHSESFTEIQDKYSKELACTLDTLPVPQYLAVSKQCVQYLCWECRSQTQVSTQLFEETLSRLVQNLCVPVTKSQPSPPDKQPPPTHSSLLQTILTDILTQPAIRVILRNLVNTATTPDTKRRVKATSGTSPWEVSTVRFLRRLFEKLPEEVTAQLEGPVKSYIDDLGQTIEQSTADLLSINPLLMDFLGCFWPFMQDLHIVKISEALVSCIIVSLAKQEVDITIEQGALLSKLLVRMDCHQVELRGQRCSEFCIVNLSFLAMRDDVRHILIQPVLKTFTRFPVYCDYIDMDVFVTGLEIGLFGEKVSGKKFPKEKLKSVVTKVVSKLVKKQVKDDGVMELVKLWLLHCRNGEEMFEMWVQEMEVILGVKGLNLCPLAEVYFRMNRNSDTKVMSILLSQQIKFLESSLLPPGDGSQHYSIVDGVEEKERALDAVLLHTQIDAVQSFKDKLSTLVHKGLAVHPTQIHCYQKLLDVELLQLAKAKAVSSESSSCVSTALCGLLQGFSEKMSKKEQDQAIVYTAYMDEIRNCLALLKSDIVDSFVKESLFDQDVKKLRAFVRQGLRYCFGEKFFGVLTGVLEVVVGVRRCADHREEKDVKNMDRSGGLEPTEGVSCSNGTKERDSEEEESDDVASDNETSEIVNLESEIENSEDEMEVESESETSGVENSESEREAQMEQQSGSSENGTISGDDSGQSASSDVMSGEEGSADQTLVVEQPLSREHTDLVQDVYSMVVSHSEFLKTMLTEGQTDVERDSLLDLLLCLIHTCGSVCDTSHLAVLFGAYGASLSSSDQKLLHLIQVYEGQGCDVTKYRPYLHGNKAIEHYSVMQNMGPSLNKEVKTSQVLECLDSALLWKSVLNMPLRRQTHSQCTVSSPETLHSTTDCYDPCFLLPSFCHLLAPENVVNCHAFVEHHCLSYVIAALSCHSNSLRALAYNVLSRFYQQLQLSWLQEKQQLLLCLDCVRNSLDQLNTKLACIISVFLAKAVVILLNPDDTMYTLINSFLLLKPSLDILNVPEFYKLFNSSSMEYKTERGWVVGLLQEGLRETSDYRIFEKRYTFKLLLTFYNSGLSDQYMKRQILHILTKACSIKTVAFDLTKNHGLLSWLGALVPACTSDSARLLAVMATVYTLWFTMLDKRDQVVNTDRRNPVLPVNVCNELIAMLLSWLPKIGCFGTKETFSTFVEVLNSALKHRQMAHQYTRSPNAVCTETGDVTVTVGHVMRLLSHWCTLNCPQEVGLTLLLQEACLSVNKQSSSSQEIWDSSTDIPLIPEQCLIHANKDMGDRQCILSLLGVIEKVKLKPETKVKPRVKVNLQEDKEYSSASVWTVIVHISLQLVLGIGGSCPCKVLHDYVRWMKKVSETRDKEWRERLVQREPLCVCIGEMVRLVHHKMKETHKRERCTLDIEECTMGFVIG